MPALRLLGRRYHMASDDVPIPAIITATFHLVWVGLLIGWLAEIQGPEDCRGVGPYFTAVGGLLAFFTLSFLLEVWAAVVGFQGAVFMPSKRHTLPAIIYCNVLCILGQVGFNSYCTWLLFSEPPHCEGEGSSKLWDPIEVLKAVVISTWIVIAGLLVLLFLTYNLFPDYQDPKQWQRQCQCLGWMCCGWAHFNKTDRQRNSDIASRLGGLFALMFAHSDTTITDLILAFGLALTLHRARRKVQALRRAKAKELARTATGLSSGTTTSSLDYTLDSAASIGMGILPLNSPRASAGTPAVVTGATPPGSSSDPGSADELLPGSSDLEVGAAPNIREVEHTGGDVGGMLSDDGSESLVDAATLKEASHYCTFAFAAYGWMLFLWDKRAVGCLELCCGRSCGLLTGVARGIGGKLPDVARGRHISREVILQASGVAESDLIFVRHDREIFNVLPYFIAVDHETKSVVISIRGSLSLDDVVRDLLFEPAELDDWIGPHSTWQQPPPPVHPAGHRSRFAAHSGILEAARATLIDIQHHGHLESLLRGPEARYSEYKLVICGHSLGAGAAFLLSLYLRQSFPQLQCYAFSPPGGLATAALCKESVDWCTSVVCGKEWIPRLTVKTFERLRNEMFFAGVRCRKPKWTVFFGWLLGWHWKEQELFYDPDKVPDEPLEFLAQYQASLDRTKAQRSHMESAAEFGPPGRVVHLKPTGVEKTARRGGGKTRQYKAVWVDASSLVDEGIIISSRMMADHMPDYLLQLLRRLSGAAERNLGTASMSDAGGQRAVDRAMHGDGGRAPDGEDTNGNGSGNVGEGAAARGQR